MSDSDKADSDGWMATMLSPRRTLLDIRQQQQQQQQLVPMEISVTLSPSVILPPPPPLTTTTNSMSPRPNLIDVHEDEDDHAMHDTEREDSVFMTNSTTFNPDSLTRPTATSTRYQELLDHIQKLEDALNAAEATNRAILMAAQQRTSVAQQELELLRQHLFDERERRAQEFAAFQAEQEAKLRDSKALIAALRQENEQLKNAHSLVHSKVKGATHVNRVIDQDCSLVGSQVDRVGDGDVPDLTRTSRLLQDEIMRTKQNNQILMKQLIQHQDSYMAQAEGRLEYQRTLAVVLTAIHATASAGRMNRNLQEHTVVLAMGAESNAKAIMAAHMALDIEHHQPCLESSDVSDTAEDGLEDDHSTDEDNETEHT